MSSEQILHKGPSGQADGAPDAAADDARGPRAARPRKSAPTPQRIARRRGRVMVAKWLLPATALLLLTLIALWPELSRDASGRFTFRRGGVDAESGKLTQARYNGVDEHNRPYTITSDFARQTTPDRIDLTSPVGDMVLENGTWLRGEGRQGVYMQQAGQLDLSGDVSLYRDDGITMQTDSATLDVKAGAASSAALVHVEGPFGTIDAQGFTLLDRGNAIQFQGPGRMVLNGAKK